MNSVKTTPRANALMPVEPFRLMTYADRLR